MKHTYTIGMALLTLASMPVAAQKTTRVRPVAVAPVIADSDSPAGHSYLGVGIADLNSDRVQALKLKDDRGVEVTQVDQDAPAGKAGLKDHDVIVGFSGTPVESAEQFKRLMRETPPGRTVALDIIREGQQQTVKVQVADRKKLESSVWPREPRDFAYVMPAMPAVPAKWAWNPAQNASNRPSRSPIRNNLVSSRPGPFGSRFSLHFAKILVLSAHNSSP